MTHRQTKTVAAGAWITGVIALIISVQPAPLATIALLALTGVIVPAVAWQFWQTPAMTMSESIQEAKR